MPDPLQIKPQSKAAQSKALRCFFMASGAQNARICGTQFFVKSACIRQTLHFTMKEDTAHDCAAKLVEQEVEHYKQTPGRNRTKYRILSETKQEDGSVIVEVIKQYNTSPVGNYLD